MRRASAPVWDCVERVVSQLGYDFVGAQYGGHANGGLLRVYIDAAQGINVDDCARVSEQLSAVLDVEDPIRESYTLEVSSPGLDRPLFSPGDFAAREGCEVRIKLLSGLDGRRNFKGRVNRVDEHTVELEADDGCWTLDLNDVDEARLVP